MKTTTSAMAVAHAGPVQRPGWLVEMHFDTVQRWSSQGTVTWGGHTWQGTGLQVEGLAVQPLRVSGTLVLDNADGVLGSLLLLQGVQDRQVTVYGFDAGALGATADALWLCQAVGASAQIGPVDVRIALRHRMEFVASPRTYVTPEAGFNHLLPADTVLRINGIDMRLERRG